MHLQSTCYEAINSDFIFTGFDGGQNYFPPEVAVTFVPMFTVSTFSHTENHLVRR